MKNLIKNFLLFFVGFLMIASFFSLYTDKTANVETASIEKFLSQINNNEITTISVNGDILNVTLKNGSKETVKKETGESLSQLLKNFNVDSAKLASTTLEVKQPEGWELWVSLLAPFLFPIIFILGLVYFTGRSITGANNKAMSFGQAQPKEFNKENNKDKVNFSDVAGVKEAKEELKEVVDFLKNPKKFTELGARIPRGVLLLGSPGTGKTLLARAVAGEANVPFFHISGSEFVEMFVGVGASRVRDLFKRAKKSAPCIIFVDEIDAVGRRRGMGMGGSHDEREQTLNQILVEMDGFDPNANVIVMAATNRPDVLDPALLRPGRFDRQVILDEPDLKDREAILKVHIKQKPLGKDVSLRRAAERTPGFSGADLANLLNEAALLAAKRDKKIIEMEDILESVEKVMLGPERRGRILLEKEKEITAYHEAGHALVAHFSPNTDPVHKVSIIARGRAGGYTLKLPTEDKHMHSKTEFLEEIAVLLAGYATEKEIFKDITTGATSDLRRATRLAKEMITDYGMSDTLGSRTYGEKEEMVFLGGGNEKKDYSEKAAEQIDKEISSFLDQGMEKAKAIIKKEKVTLDKIVKALLEKETLEKEEFDEIVRK
jgi:cell division protease FtsH